MKRNLLIAIATLIAVAAAITFQITSTTDHEVKTDTRPSTEQGASRPGVSTTGTFPATP